MPLDFKIINKIVDVDDSFKMPSVLMEKLFDKEKREEMFKEFLKYETDLSFDWFHIYFQEEYAERKTKKQDFTPESLTTLLSALTQTKKTGFGTSLDVAAGTGGLTIKKWHEDRTRCPISAYKPSNYYYQCEELSDRALPFLLFNLLIRGMNAVVVHGDVLSREVKQIYFIQNDLDDYMTFSSLNIMPHSKIVEKEFDVKKWIEEPIEHIESSKSVAERYLQVYGSGEDATCKICELA
ncbi:N-6 DNA methylase [Enterococcus thailandicus]|uniref:N-6 DNA methylase n=1 Tax=Enterococcus thailandicus TaxID=417368 RepID=UPI00288CE799|nr:N-6 DNA methylase [Enterococcus thailandicus]MDT2794280.1 N-6 DNA methylase [Enterococcus thailandicus]